MVTCWMCGKEFEPDRERLREWAESGRNFDPTDWECSACSNLTLSNELVLFCSQLCGVDAVWGGAGVCGAEGTAGDGVDSRR
jgi:hypothetical protein